MRVSHGADDLANIVTDGLTAAMSACQQCIDVLNVVTCCGYDTETESASGVAHGGPTLVFRLINDGTTSVDTDKASIQCWCDNF